jgi:hypothetical protein
MIIATYMLLLWYSSGELGLRYVWEVVHACCEAGCQEVREVKPALQQQQRLV